MSSKPSTTCLRGKGKSKIAAKHLFSGETSEELWDLINNAKTVGDLRDAVYAVYCKIQQLECRLKISMYKR